MFPEWALNTGAYLLPLQTVGPALCRALNAKLRSLNPQSQQGHVHWSLTCITQDQPG